jgi:hypothetical protein
MNPDENLDICLFEGHHWRTIPQGGDPTEPGSREIVTYCTRCGCDQSEVSEEVRTNGD